MSPRNSHWKPNNEDKENIFITILTLKSMKGHFWEPCHWSNTQLWENACEEILAPFKSIAYSSVPSNGGKQVTLTCHICKGMCSYRSGAGVSPSGSLSLFFKAGSKRSINMSETCWMTLKNTFEKDDLFYFQKEKRSR